MLAAANAALQASEEKYRFLVENSKDVTWTMDLQGAWTFISSNVEQATGYRTDEVIGKTLWDFLAPEYHDFAQDRLRRRAQGEELPPCEVLIIGKDGRRTPFELAAVPIVDDAGNLVGVQGVSRDITVRKRAEETLRESEERFRKVFEEGPIGMVLTSRDFGFFRANPAFCRMLGYTCEEMNSRTFLDVTHPEHRAADRDNVARLWQGEIPVYRTEKRYIAKNGDIRWGKLSASLIQDREGRPLYALATVEDITERKRAEEQLRRSEQDLNRAGGGADGKLAAGRPS